MSTAKLPQIKLAPQHQHPTQQSLNSLLKLASNDEGADIYSIEGVSERDILLMRIVRGIYPIASPKKVVEIVVEFEPQLAIIPTEWLYGSFVKTVHRHR